MVCHSHVAKTGKGGEYGELRSFWNCECINCGTKKIKNTSQLKQSKGCYFCQLLPKGQVGFNIIFNSYNRAHKRGLKFSLTENEFRNLVSSNCHYCGVSPSNISLSGRRGRKRVYKERWGDFVYQGIDRKDNSLDYTVENCLPCCFLCNRGKKCLSYQNFVTWIIQIQSNTKLINLPKPIPEKKKHHSRKMITGLSGLNKLYDQYIRDSLKKNRIFELSKEDLGTITSQSCFYCGSAPKQICGESKWGQYTYNGIDRKDNKIGYIKDNCVPCCKICNNSKCNIEFDKFVEYIERVRNQDKKFGISN